MWLDHESQNKVHSTLLERVATLCALRVFGRYCKRSSRVTFLTRNICVKHGRPQHLTEAIALQFVADNSAVPVPKVYCAFVHRGRSYIVMERLRGENVAKGWLRRSEASRRHICDQLRKIVDELRQIRRVPASLAISAVDGGLIWDERLPWQGDENGPFVDICDFHRHLRVGFEAQTDSLADVRTLIALQEETESTTCFTHSDLSSSNILVSGDKITGLVDWESAGWLPLYWEYVNAWHVNPQNPFWQAEVVNFLEPFPRELEMDKLRRKYFGDF